MPLRAGHRPTPTFPPSPDWVLNATFHALDGDRPIEEVIGEVAFEVAGESSAWWRTTTTAGCGSCSPTRRRAPRRTTPGGSSTRPGRAGDGSVVLDFNRTTNLPCAYTDFTTCPVPLPQNRLQVAIEAGEQMPSARHEVAWPTGH